MRWIAFLVFLSITMLFGCHKDSPKSQPVDQSRPAINLSLIEGKDATIVDSDDDLKVWGYALDAGLSDSISKIDSDIDKNYPGSRKTVFDSGNVLWTIFVDGKKYFVTVNAGKLVSDGKIVPGSKDDYCYITVNSGQ